jgi:hypothetical protein
MVRIPQDHRDRFPAAQLLDRIDIDPCLNEPGRKGVTEVIKPEPHDPRLAHRGIERRNRLRAWSSPDFVDTFRA